LSQYIKIFIYLQNKISKKTNKFVFLKKQQIRIKKR
jgi:hypothetical protein